MARPYAGSAGTHMFFGLLSIAAGVAWLCMLYLYEPLFITNGTSSSVSILSTLPAWLIVLMSAKIFCGFWFFVTGAIGCCIKSRGCTEGVYVALNVLNVIIWTPALLVIMLALGYIIMWAPALLSGTGFDGGELQEKVNAYLWLWAFPGVGVLVGIVEFILSIVSYSIVCCCRPASLNDGYEYQYEMK